MRNFHLSVLAAFALTAALAACGGGGGGSTPPVNSPTPISTATASSSPGNGTATVTGTLVDNESGAALSGISVGLAPNVGGATPAPEGTTGPSGTFTFTTSPGTYMLTLGNNEYPDPSNRPTVHEMITVTAGTNTLSAWEVPGILCGAPNNLNPCPSPSPLEESTKFRLTTLTSAEQACLSLENSTRSSNGLKPLIADEWLTEQNRFYWNIATSTNSGPAYPALLTNYNAGDGNGSTCSDLIATGFAESAWPSWSQTIWFAADSGGANNVATAEGMVDPRVTPYPTPSPSTPWP